MEVGRPENGSAPLPRLPDRQRRVFVGSVSVLGAALAAGVIGCVDSEHAADQDFVDGWWVTAAEARHLAMRKG